MFDCEICRVKLNGEVIREAHLKGAKHQKKVTFSTTFYLLQREYVSPVFLVSLLYYYYCQSEVVLVCTSKMGNEHHKNPLATSVCLVPRGFIIEHISEEAYRP